MKFKVRIATIMINIVAMVCGLLIMSVSVKDRMKLATTLPLEKDKYEEINTLVKNYVEAKKSEDFDALAKCVNKIDDNYKEEVKKENIVSKKVQNVHCYTIDGYYDNTYVVFVYQEDIWNDIDVTVPAIKQCFVCEYKGKLVVYSGTVSDSKKTMKIKEYNLKTLENPDVKELVKSVNRETEKLAKENETFKKIYEEFEGLDDPSATKRPEKTKAPDATPVPTVSADPSDAIG
jgi:hypothetical protein